MKYKIDFTNKFKKDLKNIKKQGRDIENLFSVVEKLQRGEKLEEKYRDHSLIGDYRGFRECHIEPDLLLIYKIFEDVLVLSLVRVGSHSKLFKK